MKIGLKRILTTLFALVATNVAWTASDIDIWLSEVQARNAGKPLTWNSPDLIKLSVFLKAQIVSKTIGTIEAQYKAGKLKHLGALDLKEFFQRIEGIYFLQTKFGVQLDPRRATDFYIVKQKAAFINDEWMQASPVGQMGIGLHVLLGAAGYNDENYGLSIALILSDQCLRDGLGEGSFCEGVDYISLFPATRSKLNRVQETFMAGGFTGVGGGGDYRSIEIKFAMLQKMLPETKYFYSVLDCTDVWPDKTSFVQDILNTSIETSDQIFKPNLHSTDQGFQIVLPRSQWEQGAWKSNWVDLALMGICMWKKKDQKK